MIPQLEDLARTFKEKYGTEIERKIERQHTVLRRRASRIFRNMNISGAEYHDQVNRLMADMTYLRTCLREARSDDITWYVDYIRVCIRQLYDVVDTYPSTEAWETFFKNHEKNRNKVMKRVKGLLLKKLTK